MNDDSTEKRMAGDYEVIQAVHIGDREVVLGENPQDETGMKYMCAFCRQNALFAEYSEVMASDDFPEIVELFGQRIAEQAQKTHIELNKPRIQGIDDRPITAEGCIPISYCLLCSLEVLDEQGNLKRKADMFTRRTIRPHVAVTSVDTASEALAVSISEKARVDMDYMAELSGKSPEELEKELAGVIYRDIRCAENPEDILPSLADLSR